MLQQGSADARWERQPNDNDRDERGGAQRGARPAAMPTRVGEPAVTKAGPGRTHDRLR
jgi:hypothetical protein